MVGEDKQGVGALPSDRAVVNGAKGVGIADTPVSALRASVPSADEPNPFGSLREQVAWQIMVANVPHPLDAPSLGALESRSLGYYLGLGIDHFRHPYERHNALLFKAADAVIKMLAQRIEARSDETPTAAQPEGREPGPEDAPGSPDHE